MAYVKGSDRVRLENGVFIFFAFALRESALRFRHRPWAGRNENVQRRKRSAGLVRVFYCSTPALRCRILNIVEHLCENVCSNLFMWLFNSFIFLLMHYSFNMLDLTFGGLSSTWKGFVTL